MKKILFLLLISFPLILQAQKPIQITTPYQYNKYVIILDSLISKNISLPRQLSFPSPQRTGQFCNRLDTLFYWDGGAWVKLSKNTWPEDSARYASKYYVQKMVKDSSDQLRNEINSITFEPPAGGYANNIYLDTLTSIVVSTYKTLTYNPSANTYSQAITVNSGEGDKLIASYLYPTGVAVSLYPSGLWSFNFYGSISSASGETYLGIQYFKRSTLGVETTLFTIWSSEINNLTNDWIKFATTQPNFTTDSTDRMGARLLAKTTSGANRIITVSIGNGYGAFLNTPNKIRHSQLRDLNGDTLYLHVSKADTTRWGSASGSYVDLTTDQTIAGEKTFSDTSKFSKGILVTGKININTAVSDSSINALNMHLTRGAKIDGTIQGGTVLINSGTVIDSSAITWKTAENIAKYHANNQTEYICPLSGYDVDVGDTIKIGIGNVFEDASIVITNYVIRDTLSESKVLGTGIMILPENGRLTVSTGQKISNASLVYSLSFEINADLETIDMVFINNSSASLNIKFNINRIKQ